MAQAGSVVTSKLQALLSSSSGMPAAVSVIADIQGVVLPVFPASRVIAQNVSAEIVERTLANHYPTVHVYCAKVVNLQREKFRTFSGEALMVVEVRMSQDRLEGLESQTQYYADAVTQVLDQNRGNWDDGAFYGGGYEVSYGPVKHGGRNFLQTAKISFTVDLSIN